MPCDAFISHSSQNRDGAGRLERELEDHGLSVWLDDSKIRLGRLLGPELQRSILDCGALVLLWSEAAAASRWVNSEWLMALYQERLILPCVLGATPLPQCLGNTVRLDLRSQDASATPLLRRAIRDAPGMSTPLAPVTRSESRELSERPGDDEPARALPRCRCGGAAATQRRDGAGPRAVAP